MIATLLSRLFFMVVLSLAAAGSALAATAFAVDSGGNLLRFDVATPGTVTTIGAITGLQGGENIQDIDFRPANGLLYGLGSTGRLYTINTTTAAATLVAPLTADPADPTNPFAALVGTRFSIDFNPVPDRLRVVSDAGQNLRVNAATGLATTDGDLNPGSPDIGGNGYTNSYSGATATTLYGLDRTSDQLVMQNPPNNGTIVAVGALGVNIQGPAPLDISVIGNTAYAALSTNGTSSSLYTINLQTGAATLVGSIGGPVLINGLALVQSHFTASLSGTTVTFTGSVGPDSIVFDSAGGLLRHNRFSSGDEGFNSDFDFDSSTPGDQTLSASDPAVVVIVNGNEGNDSVTIGSASSPASGLAAAFQVNGGADNDSLSVDDSADATGRAVTIGLTGYSGIGGGASVTGIESFAMTLGSGADTVQVNALAPMLAATVSTGGGADTVNVLGANIPANSTLGLDGGANTDTLTYDGGGIQPVVTSGPGAGQTTIARTGSGSVLFQNFEVAPPPNVAPLITNGPPQGGTVGVIYSFIYTATGTPTPTFAVTSGVLPPGLTLSASGAITGTPFASGLYVGVVTASNGTLPDATQTFSILIDEPLVPRIIPTLGEWTLAALAMLLAALGLVTVRRRGQRRAAASSAGSARGSRSSSGS